MVNERVHGLLVDETKTKSQPLGAPNFQLTASLPAFLDILGLFEIGYDAMDNRWRQKD